MNFVPARPYKVTAFIPLECENCGAPDQPADKPCHYCGITVRALKGPPAELPKPRAPKEVRG